MWGSSLRATTAANAGEGVTDEREGGGDVWGECSSSLGKEVGESAQRKQAASASHSKAKQSK